jgi:hypothetical protein
MTDLTTEAMLERIKCGLAENSASFGRKIIVHEGLNLGWVAMRDQLFEALQAQGWMSDGEAWRLPIDDDTGCEPTEAEFAAAYARLCEAVPPAPGLERDNLQPLIEGSYPDGEVWIEQFGSYPEMRIEREALVFYPAPLTPLQHVRYLKDRAEAFRMAAIQSADMRVSGIAWELEERADEIGRENSLPSAAGETAFGTSRIARYGGVERT